MIYIYIALGLIILGLGIYLGTLVTKLQKQKAAQAKTRKKIEDKVTDIKESIVMISKATLQGQCDPAEACIRIYNLLIFIEMNDHYPVTQKYFKEIETLSVLKKRQELSAQDAFKEDKVRFKAEDKFKEDFFEELKLLKTDMV